MGFLFWASWPVSHQQRAIEIAGADVLSKQRSAPFTIKTLRSRRKTPIQVQEAWRRGAGISKKTLQGGQMRMGRTCDDVVINLIVSPLGMAVPVKVLSPVIRKASGRGP